MGKRFGDLERRALAVLAGGGNPANSADEELKKYWQWRINPSDSSHNLPAASERPTGRKKTPVYLKPFGKDIPDTILFGASISQRSNTARTAQNLTNAVLGYEALGTKTDVSALRFRPARVYYRTGDAANSIARTSRITGRVYKSYYSAGDEGYSAPFGKVGTATQGERQSAIKTAIGANINLITFTSERI
jgi:hypothetical protein